jgi:hypothetical protein
MKNLLLLLCFFYYHSAQSSELSALVRLEKGPGLYHVIRAEDGLRIPIIPATKEMKAQLQSFSASQDLLMEGHITYVKDQEPNKLRPVFVIEKMRSLSLSDLSPGSISPEKIVTPKRVPTQELILHPTLKVTPEVASAITLTTSLLLMEELTSGPVDPTGRRELNRALFLSAGTMATLYFIYQQLKGNTHP